MPKGRAPLQLIPPTATPEETAAIVAALERFRLAMAPAAGGAPQPLERWRQAALLEGVERDSAVDVPNPWINT